jgi:multisubunit Na+/H+ antiporter MnhB subunit
MTKFKKLLSAALFVPAIALGVSLLMQPDAALAVFDKGLSDGAQSAQGKDQQGDAASLFGDGGQGGIFRTITNVMLFIIGAISVIMLIIGGIRYVVSGGDSTKVQEAKNTILYSIVGVVVAILAYAVVQFVIDSFTDGA